MTQHINMTMCMDSITGYDWNDADGDQMDYAERVADRIAEILSDDGTAVSIDVVRDDIGTTQDGGEISQEIINWAWEKAIGEVSI